MLHRAILLMASFMSTLAVAQTANQSAFESGKSLGQGKNQGMFSGITGTAAQDNIPRYGSSAPEANYFAGGKGETSGPGIGKISSCANYTPGADKVANQECEAVNFLARNPQVRPQFSIGQNDPMIQRARELRANAEQAFAQFFPGGAGSQSQCTTRTETTPGQYTTEICVSAKEVGSQQCTMGRIVNINTNSNFQCEQTLNGYENNTCNRTKVVSVEGAINVLKTLYPCYSQPVTVTYDTISGVFYYKLLGMSNFAQYTGGATAWSQYTYATCWRNEGEAVRITGISFIPSNTPVKLCYQDATRYGGMCASAGVCCSTVYASGLLVTVEGWDAYHGIRFVWNYTVNNSGMPSTQTVSISESNGCLSYESRAQ